MQVCVRGEVHAEWTRFEQDDNVHTIGQNQFIFFMPCIFFNRQNILQTYGRYKSPQQY